MPLCTCGSGLQSWWEHDARGFELCRVCPSCRPGRLKVYRPEVLTNPNYEADESIEEEVPPPNNYDRWLEQRFGVVVEDGDRDTTDTTEEEMSREYDVPVSDPDLHLWQDEGGEG